MSIFLYLDTPSWEGSRDEGERKNKKTSDFSFTHELTSDKGTCRNQHWVGNAINYGCKCPSIIQFAMM